MPKEGEGMITTHLGTCHFDPIVLRDLTMDESNLPIDIHVNKLLDWFVSRKHCTKDWADGLSQIRSRILAALQDMPENEEMVKILSGNQINYYTCLEIVEILKKTEVDSKNIFGYYSSQRMKDWQDIVKIYQKDNLYLAETAQIISRNVIHEIPSIKRSIAKLGNTGAECNKKSVDYLKLSSRLKAEYLLAAGKLGIKGEDVPKELLEQLNDFPEMIKMIHIKITSLKEVLEFYSIFIKAIGSKRSEVLPIMQYLISSGNTTVYELKRGIKPESIEVTHSSQSKEEEDTIDFGDVVDDAIDFGEDPESGSSSSDSKGNGFVHVHETDLRRDSDFNGSDTNFGSGNEKVARGHEGMSVLEFSETRETVVNEVSEVESFLSQRLFELINESDSTSFLLDQGLAQVSGNQETVVKMLSLVQEVIELITSEKIKVLYMIKDNPRYIERAVDSLKSKWDMALKAEERSRLMDQKEFEAMDEQEKLKATIPGLAEQTGKLVSLIAGEISKRYKNRRVNLMGVAQVL